MGATTRFLALLTPSPLLFHHRHHQFRLSLLRLTHSVSRQRSHHSEVTILPLNRSQSLFSSKKSSSHLHTHAVSALYSSSKFQLNHPWTEFSSLLDNLSTAGYFPSRQGSESEFFVDGADLSEEFMNAAAACLAFSKDRLNLLGMLSRRDLEAVVQNGMPFLFKNGQDSMRRMKLFLSNAGNNVLGMDSANTVDLMKFLLSYASNSSEANHHYNRELVESSVRNLLLELTKLSRSTPEFNHSVSGQNQFLDKFEQTPKPYGQTIEMKRGDWICSRCSFMNFARNVKCLECEEERPKKQLAGGEWECPQCNFFNNGRNMMCLRCDCKRPGQVSPSFANTTGSGSYASQIDIDSRLAANEEKAQRWFTKVSQLDGANISEIPDEDFPEIMPLRKGVNRFVVSTRKTPLERRLENAQYKKNLSNDNGPEAGDQQDKPLDTSVMRRLDNILARSSGQNTIPLSNTAPPRSGHNSNSVPFVPLPADMFNKKTFSDSGCINKNDSESEKSEGRFKTAAVGHDVNDVASATPDEAFPEIMPRREGANRSIIGKNNGRSLTSSRRVTTEQTGNNNYIPFVPFQPGYFANNDNRQPDRVESPIKSSGTISNYTPPENIAANQQIDYRSGNTTPSGDYSNGIRTPTNGNIQSNTNSSANFPENPPQPSENVRDSWKGKSLEGSAVKEPNPLDMSEEAKAERWFRRVAQIKDISELSQIPDEDFPSIMPMRKGVNRFVVSKRKTPLERRLTSQQYRRNLPVVSSDPLKNENENN